ncbi:hypothetical protein [Deinococcus roseus]|uniref:Uncharacterized protein n=1 Tax=Deinococcus roseus TaxID=392414 RepID=A0ABQ2DHB8_9DEIO|nr:hypothetical protein [Deinococcus roseus]GGJ55490.1 hypothetical protein GCM10008938_47060 [Deinococcus roseus]
MTDQTLQIHHFYDVLPNAAQELLMLAHLSFEFGPRSTLYRADELQHTLENLLGDSQGATLGETDLIESLLFQAASRLNYLLCIVQKAHTSDAGWVCLIPLYQQNKLKQVMLKHHLRSTTSPP